MESRSQGLIYALDAARSKSLRRVVEWNHELWTDSGVKICHEGSALELWDYQATLVTFKSGIRQSIDQGSTTSSSSLSVSKRGALGSVLPELPLAAKILWTSQLR